MRLSGLGSSLVLLVGVAFMVELPARSCAAGPPVKERVDPYGDPLPAGAIMRLGTQRWRQRDGFYDPVFSPDGRWVVAMRRFYNGGNDRDLNVWDWSTGRLVYTKDRVPFYPWPFDYYAFLPDGKRLLSQGSAELCLWDFPSFRLRKRWRVGHWGLLAVSPDGRFAAGNGWNSALTRQCDVHVVNLQTGKVRTVWKAGFGRIEALALSEDDCLVVAHMTSEPRWDERLDGTFTILRIDLSTRRMRNRFVIQAGSIRLSPDGRHLVASSLQGGLHLYRVDTGNMRQLPVTSGPDVTFDMMFRRDGRMLVTIAYLWPKFRGLVTGEPADLGPPLAWTWDVDRGELVDRVQIPEHRLDDPGPSIPILSPDGQAMLLSSTDAAARVSLRTGKPMDDWPGFYEPIDRIRWSEDGHELVGETLSGQRLKWNSATGKLLRRVSRGYSTTGQFHGLRASSADGLWEARAAHSSVQLLDVRVGKVKHKLDGHKQEVTALQYSPDSRVLASVDKGGTARLWDVERGKALRLLDSPRKTKRLISVFFSPDGRNLAAVAREGFVHVWDVQTGRYVCELNLSEELWAPEGFLASDYLAGTFISSENLIVLTYDSRIRAWNLLTGQKDTRFQEIKELPTIEGRDCPRLIHSPDGRFLFRAGVGGCLYEVASGRIVHTFPANLVEADFHPFLPRVAVTDGVRLELLIYDLPTLFRSLPIGSHPPTLQQLWDALGDRNANQAYRSVWRLTATPGIEAFLTRQLNPAAPIERAKLEKAIANLGSDDYATRQKAEETLSEAAELAQPALELALRTTKDLEQHLRLKRLLSLLGPQSRDRMRNHRAVFALEMCGTPEARRLLQKLATGAPQARLTQEAKAALRRLVGRPASAR